MKFSKKQLTVLSWWDEGSEFHSKTGIICDGAVRSGKTTAMALSFALWAMKNFNKADFALCSKTMKSAERNFGNSLCAMLSSNGFAVRHRRAHGMFTVRLGRRENSFHYAGGRDESSAALIQGMTLGGALFDEAALMPESFINQAAARCSLPGSRLWFNCNPDSPQNRFYREWVLKAEEKNLLYLHFTMDDNPSLSEEIKQRYKAMYTGAFFRRFVLGEWVAASGLVYPEAASGKFTKKYPGGKADDYAVSVDYGTVNPFSAGLWAKKDGCWYRIREYYYNSRSEGRQLTDEEYYQKLKRLCSGAKVSAVIIDPSAASFIGTVRSHGEFLPLKAKNDVIQGIRAVQSAFSSGKLFIDPACADCLREFGLYRWDEKSQKDAVIKADDHAMDDARYFVSTYYSAAAERKEAVAVQRRNRY